MKKGCENMDDETLRLLISCGTTVLVAIITQVFIYIITKINNKDSKKNSILEEQYVKIFAPIHKILFYDNIENRNRLYWEIDHIISNNYPIVPKRIRELYTEIKDKDDSEFKSFKKEISICFRYSSSMLGYSRERLSREEKKIAKKVLNQKSKKLIYSRNVFTLAFIIALINAILMDNIQTSYLFKFLFTLMLASTLGIITVILKKA